MDRYQSTSYTSFHAILDTLSNQARAIETQVTNLTDKARNLGSPSDSHELRQRIVQDESRLHETTRDTMATLEKLRDEIKRRAKDLARTDLDTFNRIENAIKVALRKHSQIIQNIDAKRKKFPNPNGSTLIDFGEDDPNEAFTQRNIQMQRQMHIDNDRLEKENEDLFNTEEQIRIVQADVMGINNLMVDIATIVSEASPIVARIEKEVDDANNNIVAGNRQLEGARRSQKKYRKKLCCILAIFFVIVVILTIVLVLKLR